MKLFNYFEKSNPTEWKKTVVKVFYDDLSPLGFSEVRGQSIIRSTDAYKHSIHFGLVDHGEEFDVSISISARISALEELIQSVIPNNSPDKNSELYSFGAELGDIVCGKRKKWTIDTSGAIKNMKKEAEELLKTHGFPFIERYSQLSELLSAITPDVGVARMICPISFARAIRAVCLAKLLKVDSFDNIVASKRLFLESVNDHRLAEFNNLVQAIQQKP